MTGSGLLLVTWVLLFGTMALAAPASSQLEQPSFSPQEYGQVGMLGGHPLTSKCDALLCVYIVEDAAVLHHLQRAMSGRHRTVPSSVLRPPLTTDILTCNRPLVVLPLRCAEQRSLREFAIGLELSGCTWLLFPDPYTSTEVLFSDLHVPFDFEVLVARKRGHLVALTEVYRVHAALPLQFEEFATWSAEDGLTASSLDLEDRRTDLRGVEVRAAVTHEPPWVTVSGRGDNVTVGGSIGNIFHELEADLNFTAVFSVEEDHVFGDLQEDGTWSGMVGMIVRQEVDLSTNPFVFAAPRMEVMDYTIPIFGKTYSIFIKVTPKLTSKLTRFSDPFSPLLWLSVTTSIVVLALSVAALLAVHHHLHGEEVAQLHEFSVVGALFCMLAIFLHQSVNLAPNPASCRVVFVTALLSSSVLFAAYSGVLVSFLTVHSVELPFHNIVDLIRDGNYKLGVFNVPTAYLLSNYFQGSSDPELRRSADKLRADELNDPPASVLEGLTRVCSSRYAFFVQVDEALSVVDDIGCKVTAVPMVSLRVNQGLALRKHSPYRNLFNQRLHKLRDTGILNKLHAEAWSWSLRPMKEEMIQTTFGDIVPLVAVLFVGVATACVLLALEHRFKRPHPSEQSARVWLDPGDDRDFVFSHKVLSLLSKSPPTYLDKPAYHQLPPTVQNS